MAKPIKSLELHYPMIQVFIIKDTTRNVCMYFKIIRNVIILIAVFIWLWFLYIDRYDMNWRSV